jgi:hypothetical protein
MTESIEDTVIDSQVLLPLERLKQEGIVFDLVLFSGIRSVLREGRERRAQRLQRARRSIAPGRLHVFWTVAPRHGSGLLWSALLLSVMVFADVLRGRPVVCHGRGLDASSIAMLVSRLLPRVGYIYDVRGDTLAEDLGGTGGSRDDGDARREARVILRREQLVTRHARVVLCVSSPLKRRLLARHPALVPAKTLVIPCAADERRFRFDPETRARGRRTLGLETSLVLAYAGALRATWQGADGLAHLVSAAMRTDPRMAFLCITPDTRQAQRLLRAEGMPLERCRIISAGHEEMAELLMAADVGLLVRPDSPVNEVASPTKLAEYLMSGLAVVYSPGIGDTARLVAELGSGSPLSSMQEDVAFTTAVDLARPSAEDPAVRFERAARAAGYLSLGRFLPVRQQAYRFAAGLNYTPPDTAFFEQVVG